MPCREPNGEMAAGGVTNGDDTLEIKRIFFRENTKVVRTLSDIEEGVGPRSSGVANAPVLEVPRGDASVSERRAQVAGVFEAVLRAPEAAVNHDSHGMRTGALGQAQIAELKLVSSVGQTDVGRRCGQVENFTSHGFTGSRKRTS